MEVVVSVKAYSLLFLLVMLHMFILLWATKLLAGFERRWGRLMLAAFFSALYSIATDLAAHGVFPGDRILGDWRVGLSVSVLTYLAAFFPAAWSRTLRGLGYYYLLVFIGVGASFTAQQILIMAGAPPFLVDSITPVVNLVVFLAVAEWGWGVVQRWLWQRVLYFPLEITLMGRELSLTAMLDTGNQLKEPIRGAPVVVVGLEGAKKLLPPEILTAVAQAPTSGLDPLIRSLEGTPWANRLRVIPFTSLGKENGILVGFRPDKVRLLHPQQVITLEEVVVGFYHRRLAEDGSYQALVHPELLHGLISDDINLPSALEQKVSATLGR